MAKIPLLRTDAQASKRRQGQAPITFHIRWGWRTWDFAHNTTDQRQSWLWYVTTRLTDGSAKRRSEITSRVSTSRWNQAQPQWSQHEDSTRRLQGNHSSRQWNTWTTRRNVCKDWLPMWAGRGVRPITESTTRAIGNATNVLVLVHHYRHVEFCPDL